MARASIANDGVQYRRTAREDPSSFHCLARSEHETLTGTCLHRRIGTRTGKHTNTRCPLDATCCSVRSLFHYLLRLRQAELPPAKRSLPNRQGLKARTQCTLETADSIREVCDQGKEKEIQGKNQNSDIKNTGTGKR